MGYSDLKLVCTILKIFYLTENKTINTRTKLDRKSKGSTLKEIIKLLIKIKDLKLIILKRKNVLF